MLHLFWVRVVVAALLSTAIALGQWLSVHIFDSYAIDMPPVSGKAGRQLPALLTGAVFVTITSLTALVVVDYVGAEQSGRHLRFEAARIGHAPGEASRPQIRLLTQLRDFYRFARTPATRGMEPIELDAMRKVAERYGYPPTLFRYALAAAINGRPDAARLTLVRLCKLHGRQRCEEGRQAWAEMARGQYPELAAVAWPVESPRP